MHHLLSWTSIITERETGPSWCGPRAPELCHCQQHFQSSLPPPVPVLCAWILSCFHPVGWKSSVEKNGASILNYFFFWRDLQGPSLSKRIQDTQSLPHPSHASWTFIGYLPSQTLIPLPVLHHHHHASSRHNTSTKEDQPLCFHHNHHHHHLSQRLVTLPRIRRETSCCFSLCTFSHWMSAIFFPNPKPSIPQALTCTILSVVLPPSSPFYQMRH